MRMFLDESGFTGSDYVNQDQPFFVLGSHWLSDPEVSAFQELVARSFRGNEIKFRKLIKTLNGKVILRDVITFLAQHKTKYCVYVVDKKSALVRRFVDDCIEPSMAEAGLSPNYKERWAYANLFSTTMPAFMGPQWYEAFLVRCNAFLREKDPASLGRLLDHCLLCSSNESALEIVSPFVANPKAAFSEVNRVGYTEDIFETIILGLIVHCRNHFGITNFDVVYDSTSATTDSSLGAFVQRLHGLPRMFKVSEVCSIYPDIVIERVRGVDSKSSAGIALSDVLAGLANWTFRSQEHLESDIGKAFLTPLDDRNFIHMVNSPDVTPDGIGVLDGESPWE